MNTLTSFRAEWLKLRKRPAVWIMALVLAAIVLLFGYLVLYAFVTQTPPDAASNGFDGDALLQSLQPVNLPSQVLGIVAGFGSALGLILGALAVGSEYGWATVKTMTTQRPGRLALMGGRAGALLCICVLFALAAFLGGIGGAGLVSLLEPADTALPTMVDLATAFAVSVLIIAVWCGLGVCLATLFRGTGWAIGIGLLYAFALELLLSQLPLRGRAGELLSDALIGNNTTALTMWLSPDGADPFGVVPLDIGPLQAILVLLAYLAVAMAVATIVYWRRDIA